MDSSPSKHTEPTLPPPALASSSGSLAGAKRPAPTLLPPFEPLSSSPGLPRPAKRHANESSFPASTAYLKYPTPFPTSSTGILSSSPPGIRRLEKRPAGLTRNLSGSAAERSPLSAVPTIVLSGNGDSILMGRSSNSSNYQLSANPTISRVHVKARYIPAPSPLEPSKVEIVCNGWNGLTLHCQGRTYNLHKGDTFTSETEGIELMLDVQDARVRLQWPKRGTPSSLSEASWDESPTRTRIAGAGGNVLGFLQSSPLRRSTRIESPESPTPGSSLASSKRLQMLLPRGDLGLGDDKDEDNVEIYVDPSADEDEGVQPSIETVDPNISRATQVTNSFSSSDLSEPEDDDDEEHNPDEENDPIVHSFGPFGSNISSRLASITASSPKVHKGSRRTELPTLHEYEQSSRETSPEPAAPPYSNPAISNHVVNQLAYSRLSSTPLSIVMQNLPQEEQRGVTTEQLRELLESTACVGVIERQGKDAAGKPLESEYYYMPELDTDEQRRAAVVDGLRKPSLRACRKQHKQYYWKRPKTP